MSAKTGPIASDQVSDLLGETSAGFQGHLQVIHAVIVLKNLI
jgi:hypothetical protein